MTQAPVDLSQLHIDTPALPRRPLGPRLLLLAALLLVIGVAATFLWPLLRPVRKVAMTNVRAASAMALTHQAMAEAVGWVEPDPFPVIVRPLVAGRIKSIEVLETAAVEAGKTVIARLESAALLAAHERTTAMLGEREQELREAQARAELAQAELGQNAARRTAVLEVRSMLADKDQKLAAATGALATVQARERGVQATLLAQQELQSSGASNRVALLRVEAEVAAAAAEVEAARAGLRAVTADVEATRARLQLAEELAKAPVDLQGAAKVAAAAVDKAQATLTLAQRERDIAARELAWTEVLAPVSGNVLKLLAAPGDTVGPEGMAILSLYDPAHLRARIDVPFASLSSVQPGQQVELRSEVTGVQIVSGTVQRLQSESDLLKNTLQVKIALLEQPPLWKPETLVRARFLGGDREGPATVTTFAVPRRAVRNQQVFVYDPAARAARAVHVEVLSQEGEDAVVRGELSITQRVILDDVRQGERVAEEQR